MTDERPPRTMTVPEVRARLYELADVLGSSELHRLADQLWRRSPVRQPVRPSNRHVTDEVKEQVRAYVERHPREPMDHVGMRFGINQGRVSEILHGFRGEP